VGNSATEDANRSSAPPGAPPRHPIGVQAGVWCRAETTFTESELSSSRRPFIGGGGRPDAATSVAAK